jgi:hypothetical protein
MARIQIHISDISHVTSLDNDAHTKCIFVYYLSTFHCRFLIQPSQYDLRSISPTADPTFPGLSKFCHNAPPPPDPQQKNSAQILNLFPLLHSQTIHLPSPYVFSFPNALPCLQLTFTRRTSGHCLGNLPPPHNNKCSAPHYTPLFIFHVSKGTAVSVRCVKGQESISHLVCGGRNKDRV